MKKLDSDMLKIRLSWYYERLQATGRSSNRILWVLIILFFGALLIKFATNDAKEIKLFNFSFQSLEKIIPAIIFLLLMVIQGSFIAVRDSINSMNEIMPRNQKALKGVYEIDKNLNFVDYLAFIVKRKRWGQIFEPLLYPLCILLIAFSSILLLGDQIGIVLAQEPISGAGGLLFLNLLFGFFCYMVSRQFFKDRWKRFRLELARKRQ